MAATNKTSVLFIVPAPEGISPGQRFRHEQYLDALEKAGIRYRVSSFYSPRGWRTLYTRGNKLAKTWYVVRGLLKRCLTLFTLKRFSHVYIYREATPVGAPFFEYIAAKWLRMKMIYDFDDAIWLPVTSEFNKGVSWLRNFKKVGAICRWATRVTVGNRYLAAYASRYNPDTVIIPTVVNTMDAHNRMQDQRVSRPAVGWTGSFSTLSYLQIVLPVLKRLQEKNDFDFIVIADKDPELPLSRYQFIKWNKDSEAEDLLKLHIGLMPLNDDDVSRGKCGFKAIQYMSLGIPAIVSPVGVNAEIVEDGVNGYVCRDAAEWEMRLEELLKEPALRERMGAAAREKIEERYSVNATREDFLNLFRNKDR